MGNGPVTHTWESYGLKPGAEQFPLMIILAVAYPCNALCPHCPYTNSDIRKSYRDTPWIAPELFKKIADEAGKYGAYIRITGGGEPFLHKDLVEMVEYAKSVGARIGIITNGSKCTPDKIDRLLACHTDAIEYSVDADDPQTYAIVRKGLDWETLLKNVHYTIEKRNALKSETKIIASVVHQDIIADKIDRVINFWSGLVDTVIKRKFLTWGYNTRLTAEKSGDPSAYLGEGVPCPFPFERLNIDTRGQVMVCGFDISGVTNFGNVNHQSIGEIWRGPQFEAWRQKHLEGRGGEIDMCSQCPDWKYRSWTHNYWKVLGTAGEVRKARLSKLDFNDMEGEMSVNERELMLELENPAHQRAFNGNGNGKGPNGGVSPKPSVDDLP